MKVHHDKCSWLMLQQEFHRFRPPGTDALERNSEGPSFLQQQRDKDGNTAAEFCRLQLNLAWLDSAFSSNMVISSV